jgi:hypothetical protein
MDRKSREAQYLAAKKAFNTIADTISVPATERERAIARRFVDASRYQFRRPHSQARPDPSGTSATN